MIQFKKMMTRGLLFACSLSFCGQAVGQEKKSANLFTEFLELDQNTSAEIGFIAPPKEIDQYRKKIHAASQKDEKWFAEYVKKNKPGLPFSFDKKMGLTKEEHDEYLAIWAKRTFKVVAPVEIKLVQSKSGVYSIIGAGPAAKFTMMKYTPAKNTITSPKGTLSRLPDINADPLSIFGAWTGYEWKLEEKDDFATIKENFAIGALPDKQHGILIYRFQELSSFGPFAESILIRFPLKK